MRGSKFEQVSVTEAYLRQKDYNMLVFNWLNNKRYPIIRALYGKIVLPYPKAAYIQYLGIYDVIPLRHKCLDDVSLSWGKRSCVFELCVHEQGIILKPSKHTENSPQSGIYETTAGK